MKFGRIPELTVPLSSLFLSKKSYYLALCLTIFLNIMPFPGDMRYAIFTLDPPF